MVWSLTQSLIFTRFRRGEFESLSLSTMTVFCIFPLFSLYCAENCVSPCPKKKNELDSEVVNTIVKVSVRARAFSVRLGPRRHTW